MLAYAYSYWKGMDRHNATENLVEDSLSRYQFLPFGPENKLGQISGRFSHLLHYSF